MKSKKAKEVFEKASKTSIQATKHFIRWIFFFIIIYIGVAILIGIFTGGSEYIQNIVTISVGGFFAFFLGYFGWRLGQVVEEYFGKPFK